MVKESGSKPYCANCEELGHPANWRGCPYFKDYLDRKNTLIDAAKERRRTAQHNVNRFVNSGARVERGRSYASNFYSDNPSTSDNRSIHDARFTQTGSGRARPNLIQQFLEVAEKILGPEKRSLEKRIENFLNNFKTLSKENVRKECESLLKEVRNHYGP